MFNRFSQIPGAGMRWTLSNYHYSTSFGEMLIFIIELPMTDKLAFENMTKIS